MSNFEDHHPCPALDQWLPRQWEGQRVAACTCAPSPKWSPPRGVRRLMARDEVAALPEEPLAASVDVLIVGSVVPGSLQAIDGATWEALRPGGLLIDIAALKRRGPLDLLRPWVRDQRLREATAERVREWLQRGAYEPEQWIPIAPSNVVVTMVRRAALPGSC